MAQKTNTLTAVIKWRWWLKHYLLAVLLMARLTGREPNWTRFHWWVRRGIKIEMR